MGDDLLSGGPPVESRRSRIAGRPGRREGRRGVAIAIFSTVVVLAAIVIAVTSSPYWPEVKNFFFNRQIFVDSLPQILSKFRRNILYFCIAEVFVLALALLLAVMRSLPGPVFTPIRGMAIIYTDVFRGIPTILVVYLLAFGIPALQIPGVPSSATVWAIVGLILSYSAYVSEVYRAGIESIHPSQVSAARSLGLSRGQSLRHVVVPQAIRRVVPPLMNDFVALQKDTAIIAFVIAVPEAFKWGQVLKAASFNMTPLVVVSLVFLMITIPMTRLTDYLVERERRRRQSGSSV
jgi:polar amino acid transport system permease protein